MSNFTPQIYLIIYSYLNSEYSSVLVKPRRTTALIFVRPLPTRVGSRPGGQVEVVLQNMGVRQFAVSWAKSVISMSRLS